MTRIQAERKAVTAAFEYADRLLPFEHPGPATSFEMKQLRKALERARNMTASGHSSGYFNAASEVAGAREKCDPRAGYAGGQGYWQFLDVLVAVLANAGRALRAEEERRHKGVKRV